MCLHRVEERIAGLRSIIASVYNPAKLAEVSYNGVAMNIRRLTILAALLFVITPILALASSASPSSGPASRPAKAGGKAVVIRLDGDVDDYTRNALFRRFAKARELGADTIILEIDTYGGLVTSGLDISRFIKNQRDLRIIAFVNDKAISAGSMIALACDEIYMVPSATMGDCAPIVPGQTLGDEERSKAVSPILPDFAESAQQNGYDPLLAQAMVQSKYVVHYLENDAGERRFVNAADYKGLTESGKWRPVPGVPNPVDDESTLLTVHSDLAVKVGLAKGTFGSADALAQAEGLQVLDRLSDGAGDKIIAVLSSPIVRMLLMVIFINSLFIALKTPGTGGAEAIAVLTLVVLLGVPMLTGYAQWWMLAMVIMGIALIVFEIFVFPGHLISLLVGTLLVLIGLVLTFVGDAWQLPGSWKLPQTWDALETGLYVIVGGLACSLLLSWWLRKFLPSLPYVNRLILSDVAGRKTTVAADDEEETEPGDTWPFVGTVGKAATDLRPGGSAEFPYGDDTRLTDVVCEGGFVPVGTKVVVKELRGGYALVRKVRD